MSEIRSKKIRKKPTFYGKSLGTPGSPKTDSATLESPTNVQIRRCVTDPSLLCEGIPIRGFSGHANGSIFHDPFLGNIQNLYSLHSRYL